MISRIDLKGWIERDGRCISERELTEILSKDPGEASNFGGEFFIEWDCCKARDLFGIVQGASPPGLVICGGEEVAKIDPAPPRMELGKAIEKAVELRSDEGIVAFSGGVDSALVAFLAQRVCVTVGLERSHDLKRAQLVAKELDLSLDAVVIDPGRIETVLQEVLVAIPRATPVDASIATTLYFVAERARDVGHERILAGQGADELFGGYARYLESENLARDLERDFAGLKDQVARDQATASIHGAYFSMPYLDTRVVQASQAIPAEEKVRDGVRKLPLRTVAERHMPPSIALYEKKAMQYGSGVWREIQRLSRRKGYKRSVQGYLDSLRRAELI